MNKRYVCIICPNCCEIEVEYSGDEIKEITGNICDKGEEYVRKELFCPERGLTTTVKVKKGSLPLVSVKTSKTIPKELMMEVMKEILRLEVDAPVKIGDILIKNVLDTKADIIATKNISLIGRG
ncbi:MAG: DUF1667 domain-containing protein [Candidatus Altiarchaeota archaeon]|nr:DUF1667 domain-containing protein [Candidatus Altiarchaeota archaeon]